MKFIREQPLLVVFLQASPLKRPDFTALQPEIPFLQFNANMGLV